MRLDTIRGELPARSARVDSPSVAATTLPDLTDERGKLMDMLAEKVETQQAKLTFANAKVRAASTLLEPLFAEHLVTGKERCVCDICKAYRILTNMRPAASGPMVPDFCGGGDSEKEGNHRDTEGTEK